jgi:thiol-disulfide isomerase/thioredoxin
MGEIGGEPVHLMITERNMDGIFSTDDAWGLARDPKDLGSSSTALGSHCWFEGRAWRVVDLDPLGRRLTVEAFDPGFTEAEEKARREQGPSDADAPRAEQPLQFGHDLAAALARAKREGRKVFVDFETTWCGPCKAMDKNVYTSRAVVEAAGSSQVLCVKLDGDDEFELVKRYKVSGYPTMLLLDADGDVLAREVGYRSIPQMVEFLGR